MSCSYSQQAGNWSLFPTTSRYKDTRSVVATPNAIRPKNEPRDFKPWAKRNGEPRGELSAPFDLRGLSKFISDVLLCPVACTPPFVLVYIPTAM